MTYTPAMPPPPGVPAQGGQFQGREPIQVGFAPSAPQSRVTIFFRWLMIIPHAIVLYFVQIGAAFVFFIGWWAALFTGRLPDSFAEFLTGTLRWYTRVHGYQSLLYDAYPPFTFDDADYPLRLATRPGRLNRAAVFFRIILIFPAFLLTALILYGQVICGLVIWLIVLITGRMPESLYQATAAVVRWFARVQGFYWMLTSEYPGGLFGDPAGSAQGGAANGSFAPSGFGQPDQGGYGQQQAYGQQPGYGQTRGYGQQQAATASSPVTASRATGSSRLTASSRATARPVTRTRRRPRPATARRRSRPTRTRPPARPARPAPPARPPPRARSRRAAGPRRPTPTTARAVPGQPYGTGSGYQMNTPGYQTAPGYGTAPYSPTAGYGQVAMANQDQWAVRGAPPWPLVLSDGAKKLVALFIGLGPLVIVGVAILAVAVSTTTQTSVNQSLDSLGQPTVSQGTGAGSGNGSGSNGSGGTHGNQGRGLSPDRDRVREASAARCRPTPAPKEPAASGDLTCVTKGALGAQKAFAAMAGTCGR